MIDKRNTTVAVAMSGGVDSSLTAALLQEQGYNVIGITMRLTDTGRGFAVAAEDDGSSLSSIADAKAVAKILGIPHYVVDFRDRFRREVIDDFLSEYAHGRTPNPCVICNRRVKFQGLWDVALELGADYLATGHYARIGLDEATGRYYIRKGIDSSKDQAYALYRLPQDLLQHVMMPLGELHKSEVRELAKRYKLPVYDKPESQEICFVPDDDYKAFIREHNPVCLRPGDIVDTYGNVLGQHNGVALYTIGQRKGLGIAAEHPLYVIGLDVEKNQVIVGTNEQVFAKGLIAHQMNWVSIAELKEPLEASVKIRYGNREGRALLTPLGDGMVKAEFAEPVRAVTPGQSMVAYDGDCVIGGGIILKAI